ncbi:MAG: hypothetical protein JST58_16700 [Bacteroidetes bacterium]|nr:hypothetical protein [Bacteroidota bacterium]
MTDRVKLINDYFHKAKAANKELTKKEIFKDLLHRLYSGEKEIEEIIDAISAGAEKTILNIPVAINSIKEVQIHSTIKSSSSSKMNRN